jgi:hypothetical protein
MNMDLVSMAQSLQLGKTQFMAEIAVLKKSHEMDAALIDMIAKVADSAPPPSGQGRIVDKRA